MRVWRARVPRKEGEKRAQLPKAKKRTKPAHVLVGVHARGTLDVSRHRSTVVVAQERAQARRMREGEEGRRERSEGLVLSLSF
jgi:hypothetical protein